MPYDLSNDQLRSLNYQLEEWIIFHMELTFLVNPNLHDNLEGGLVVSEGQQQKKWDSH